MLENIFSHRSPLYDLFDKAELRALHPSCACYGFLRFTSGVTSADLLTPDLFENFFCLNRQT